MRSGQREQSCLRHDGFCPPETSGALVREQSSLRRVGGVGVNNSVYNEMGVLVSLAGAGVPSWLVLLRRPVWPRIQVAENSGVPAIPSAHSCLSSHERLCIEELFAPYTPLFSLSCSCRSHGVHHNHSCFSHGCTNSLGCGLQPDNSCGPHAMYTCTDASSRMDRGQHF